MAFVKTKIDAPADDADEFLFSSSEISDLVICKSPEKLQILLNSIAPGKQIHYVSDGDWSMHDLVMLLLKRYQPADLFITTYALREIPVRQLIMAAERKELVSVNMLIDYRAKSRTPEVFQLASMNINKIYLTNVHAKVTVLRAPGGSISIVGSANWTQNPRIECGVISTDISLANFHINWIEKVMSNAEIFG